MRIYTSRLLFALFSFLLCLQASASAKYTYKNKNKNSPFVNAILISSKKEVDRHGRAVETMNWKLPLPSAYTADETHPPEIRTREARIGGYAGSVYWTSSHVSEAAISGSSDFSVQNDSCSDNTSMVDSFCRADVKFQPSSIGVKSATLTYVLTYHHPSTSEHDPERTDVVTHNFLLSAAGLKRPLKCDGTEKASIIGISSRTLSEQVDIVGTDLFLRYSSEYAPEYVSETAILDPQPSFNLEGWTNSLHHFYSSVQTRLFMGSGEVRSALYEQEGANLLVVNADKDEVYIFSEEGKHLETRTMLTGALKYSFAYDVNDRLVKITDAFSNQITFTRNSNGHLTSIISPYGQVTTLGLDSNGRIVSITDPGSRTYSMSYKAGTGLLQTFTNPKGVTSTFSYNTDGKLIKDSSAAGSFWELVESSGNIIKTSAMGRSTTYNSSYRGPVHTRVEVSPSGFTEVYDEGYGGDLKYSSALYSSIRSATSDERFGVLSDRIYQESYMVNSVNKVTNFNQTVTYLTGVEPGFFNYSSLTKTISTNGKYFTQVYNADTKKWTSTSPAGVTSETILNSHEQPVSIKIGNDTATTISYDTKGRVSSSAQGSFNQMTLAYNGSGYLSSVTNALNQSVHYGYNLAGQVTSMTLPDSRMIQYSRDANGNITGVTPPGRLIHAMDLNGFDLMSAYKPPTLSGVSVVNTTYSYNNDKQLTNIARPDGGSVQFNYNTNSGLLDSLNYSRGTNYITYGIGDLVSRIDSPDGIRSQYQYYGLQLKQEEQTNISTGKVNAVVSYTFDSEHRRQSRTIQGQGPFNRPNTISTTYNDDDMPTKIGAMTYSYEYPSGRLSSTHLDNISDSRSYDSYGNLSGYSASYNPSGGPSQILYSYTLSRDSIGRIASKSETVLGVTDVYNYSYDSAGRLIDVQKNNSPYSSYIYDSNSNRTSGVIAGTAFTATYDNQDRMLTFNDMVYSYNANGEHTQTVYGDTTSSSYAYDSFGKLQSATLRDGKVITFKNDGRNRQVVSLLNGSLQSKYIYEDDYKIAAQICDAGLFAIEYVYGTSVNSPDYFIKNKKTYKVIKDHLGSPRLIVNSYDGTVAQRIDYNDFGKVIADSAPGFQDYGFAGGIYDPKLRLVKFGERYYDPEVGRWTSKDPILFGGGDTNLFGYVQNDPVNSIDPTGKSAVGVVLGGLCAAYDIYDTFSTLNDIRNYQNQLADINKQIAQLDEEKDCDKIASLRQQGIKISKELAHLQASGPSKSLAIAAICLGLTKF